MRKCSRLAPHVWGRRAMLALAACFLVAGVNNALAESSVVTLMAGSPRMVGESIRPLQAILSGRVLETGEADAVGLLVDDVVVHIGMNSRVRVFDEAGRKRIVVEEGYAVFYTEAASQTVVVAETPFGKLNYAPGQSEASGSGWYSIRHDLERPNASPAVSTFAAMEGGAEVVGTVPVAGPYALKAGQRWRIVQGQIPGPPEEGDERGDAEDLRRMLHREAAETVRFDSADITGLVTADLIPTLSGLPEEVLFGEGQGIIDVSAANQGRLPPNALPPILPPEIEQVTVYAVADPVAIAAGTPVTAVGQFVSYAGVPANPDWNDFLTSVGRNPAFQPTYLTEFANGGLSYIQLAGADAAVIDNAGEMFLAGPQGASTGWATFTPLTAIADAGFDPASPLSAVVTEGFRAIAYGERLPGGGTIGGDGTSAAFATVVGNEVQFNATLPAGYPRLDRADDVTGLTVGGAAVSDQIAALGAGHDPQRLGTSGPQLVFLSTGTTDALGNGFNFDGDAIAPTDLNLPGDRTVRIDSGGAAGMATPLASGGESTVGIQFAGSGETIAIIHHTGLRNPAEGTEQIGDNFEIERGSRYSIVRWQEGGRVAGANGEPLELTDLNGDADLRNELFAIISSEVNQLVPEGSRTVAGPAVGPAQTVAVRVLRSAPGRLVRSRTVANRRVVVRGIHTRAAKNSLTPGVLRSGTGRLIRPAVMPTTRRHIGRVSPGR